MIGQGMSKAGLEALTRYLAGELSSYDVRVNAISSCPVDTNALRRIDCSDAEINLLKYKMENNVPMGRIAKPDDIVRAIIFLASNKSKCITGQIIRVDGGRGLTSSGYVHYRGIKHMNARFEADGVRIGDWFSEIKRKYLGEKSIVPFQDLKQATKFVEEKIKESNFSTNLSDAHLSISSGYKYVDTNDEKLKKKFIERNYEPVDPVSVSSFQQSGNEEINNLIGFNNRNILEREENKITPIENKQIGITNKGGNDINVDPEEVKENENINKGGNDINVDPEEVKENENINKGGNELNVDPEEVNEEDI